MHKIEEKPMLDIENGQLVYMYSGCFYKLTAKKLGISLKVPGEVKMIKDYIIFNNKPQSRNNIRFIQDFRSEELKEGGIDQDIAEMIKSQPEDMFAFHNSNLTTKVLIEMCWNEKFFNMLDFLKITQFQ